MLRGRGPDLRPAVSAARRVVAALRGFGARARNPWSSLDLTLARILRRVLRSTLRTERAFRALGLLPRVAPYLPETAAVICRACIEARPSDSRAYLLLARLLTAREADAEVDALAAAVQIQGMQILHEGDLEAAIRFFEDTSGAFPGVCPPYAVLYGHIRSLIRALPVEPPPARTGRKRLVISLSVWGDRYVQLLTDYFVPSILSRRNLPELSRVRDVSIDIYTPGRFITSIEKSASIQRLSGYATIRYIEFPEMLTSCREYTRNPSFRYFIYGGFHHVSLERARCLDADLLCIAPDGVHSDGAFTSYIRFVDQGYRAVLFTSVRGQAEAVLPILDGLRDQETQTLTLSSRELVGLTVKYLHHDFKRQVAAPENRHVPDAMSVIFFPAPHGFFVRAFHLHPVVISAASVKKDIRFDYSTVDENMLSRMFSDPTDWERIKIIDDTDDGVMLDLTYTYEEHPYPERSFSPEHIARWAPHFEKLHHWNFGHRIKYHCDEKLSHIGSFLRRADGSLEPIRLSLPSPRDPTDEHVAACVARALESDPVASRRQPG